MNYNINMEPISKCCIVAKLDSNKYLELVGCKICQADHLFIYPPHAHYFHQVSICYKLSA